MYSIHICVLFKKDVGMGGVYVVFGCRPCPVFIPGLLHLVWVLFGILSSLHFCSFLMFLLPCLRAFFCVTCECLSVSVVFHCCSVCVVILFGIWYFVSVFVGLYRTSGSCAAGFLCTRGQFYHHYYLTQV